MNRATRVNVAALGTVFGISGMSHGFFETLQGNSPTNGLFIAAIGETHRMWPHGSEYAFTLIPNFLATGIAAMLAGLAVIVWSAGFVHKKIGPAILLLLFILLLLTGGGIAQLLFFPWLWLVSTRINKPLDGWRNLLPPRLQKSLGRLWPVCLATGVVFLVFALVIAVTGFVPRTSDPDGVLSVMIAFLGSQVLLYPLTFITGFARDTGMPPETART